MALDRFLVYGVLYRDIRDSLARAILSVNTDELIASLEVKFGSLLSGKGQLPSVYYNRSNT